MVRDPKLMVADWPSRNHVLPATGPGPQARPDAGDAPDAGQLLADSRDRLGRALACDELILNEDLAAWAALRAAGEHPVFEIQQCCPLDTPRRQTLLIWRLRAAADDWVTLLELRIAGAAVIGRAQLDLLQAVLHGTADGLAAVRALERNCRLADTDALTGLLNRRGFMRAAREMLQSGSEGTLLALDVDRFKQVNDVLGHTMGDAYLRGVAARLGALAPKGSLVARMGGDEFAVLLPGASDAAQTLAEAIHKALQQPLYLSGEAVRPRMSIGICSLPDDVDSLRELLRCADLAMFNAKRDNRRTECYSPDRHRSSSATLRMESRLERALLQDRLHLQVQPIYCLRSNRPTEIEVLLRWRDEELGIVPPSDFIPLAESIGLITELDFYVVRKALRETRNVQEAISINITAPTLYTPGFNEFVLQQLREAGRPPGTLIIEITERVLADTSRAATALQGLTRHGVRIAVDDFGAGYSSLGLLASLPLSRLKVDKAFMIGSHRNPRYLEVTMGILKLSAALGLESLVEGVEDSSDLPWLRTAGCDYAQGFGLARPVLLERYLQATGQMRNFTGDPS